MAARWGGLRYESLTNPLGIDVTQPRLSWVLESTRRGEQQTAYQILVASSAELLKQNTGDYWDSGKVASDQSLQVVYDGEEYNARLEMSGWDQAGFDAAEWEPAQVLGAPGCKLEAQMIEPMRIGTSTPGASAASAEAPAIGG